MEVLRGSETIQASSADEGIFEQTGVVIGLGGAPELSLLADGSVSLYLVDGGGIRSMNWKRFDLENLAHEGQT